MSRIFNEAAHIKLRTFAACANEPVENMFGPEHAPVEERLDVQARTARRLCAKCPVIDECRQEGRKELWGLWGGIVEGQPGRPQIYLSQVQHTVEEGPVDYCRCHNCRSSRRFESESHVRRQEFEARRLERNGDRVLAEVSLEFWIPVADIVGRSQKPDVLAARREVCVRMRELDFSFPQIGRVINRDHSSVMHALGLRKGQRGAA